MQKVRIEAYITAISMSGVRLLAVSILLLAICVLVLIRLLRSDVVLKRLRLLAMANADVTYRSIRLAINAH